MTMMAAGARSSLPPLPSIFFLYQSHLFLQETHGGCGPQGIVEQDDDDDQVIKLGIARVKTITDHRLLHNYMLGLSHPIGEKLAHIINQALSVRKQFEQCEISLVNDGHVDNVVKLAKEGLDDEIAIYLARKEKTESCRICFEDVDTAKFHVVEGCTHRFCLACTKKHMEVMLLGGKGLGCPQLGCTTKTFTILANRRRLPACWGGMCC